MTRYMFQGMFGIDGKGLLAWETLVETRCLIFFSFSHRGYIPGKTAQGLLPQPHPPAPVTNGWNLRWDDESMELSKSAPL